MARQVVYISGKQYGKVTILWLLARIEELEGRITDLEEINEVLRRGKPEVVDYLRARLLKIETRLAKGTLPQ